MDPRPGYNTTVAQALKNSSFHKEQCVELIDGQESYALLVFKILDLDSRSPLEQASQLAESLDAGEDSSETLLEHIFKLTPSEFQDLAREYLKAKGFADAEIEIVIRMKM